MATLNHQQLESSRENGKASKQLEELDDTITKCIGQMGLWQIGICIAIILVKFPVAWHQMAIIFLAPPVNFECTIPQNTEKCSPECRKIVYDNSTFESTITTEWNLICNHSYLANLSQTFVMVGILLGSMLFGIWADKCGRRIPLIVAIFIQLTSGLGAVFAPWFWLFCICRFLTALATGGTMVASFVLLMEVVGPDWRGLISTLYHIPFNVAHISLAIFGYFLRDWRYFQFAITIPSVILLSYYWILPESPRWLFSTNKLKESSKILEIAAKRNNAPLMDIKKFLEEEYKKKYSESTPVKTGDIRDLFRCKNMRLKTICICFNWLACGLTFFGVAQYTGTIGGNIFVNVAASASFGIPGSVLCIFMVKYLGRRLTLITSNTVAGLSMLLIMFLPKDFNTARIVCSSAGIAGMAISFPTSYLYASELFPTVIRNAGVGLCSLIARLGSMVAPYFATFTLVGPMVFGILPLIGAGLTFLLPETRGYPLPETLEDGENFGKKSQKIGKT